MATPRPTASQLRKLLDGVAAGVYIVDSAGRLVVVNPAVAAWAGVDADSLVGQTCRYHGQPDDRGEVPIAARLCPPPEVFAGQRMTALVSLVASCGSIDPRQVEFIPLMTAEGEASLVVALVGGRAAAELEAPADDLSAPQRHAALEMHRRRLGRRYAIDQLLGESTAARRIRAQVAMAAAGCANVLIVGPTGSGRQHVARTIHHEPGDAHDRPWVPLACPLLGLDVLESSIHALSRPRDDAGVGTLLLQEVDQLAAEGQATLLKALNRDNVPFRVLATARRLLVDLAANGEFHPDLAALISALVIELPPLAERAEDVPLLAQSLLEQHNAREAKQVGGFVPDVLDLLATYAWPGNLDELAEVIHAAHRRAAGPLVTRADLPERLELAAQATARPRRGDQRIVLPDFLAQIEKELISRALARAKGNKAKAARLLGMTRPRLYRRMVQLGLAEEK